MRRRGLGVGAIHRQQQIDAKYQEMSATLAKEQLEKLSQQFEVFRDKLQNFAIDHKKDIKKNPEFRRAFQKMCANIGVDPLYSSTNFWTKMLGIGSIYYELAVQIAEICMALNPRTGGIMQIDELYDRLIRSRNATSKSDADISIDDVVKAIEKMSILGNGIQLVKCQNTFVVQSLSSELNLDQNEIVKQAQENQGFVNVPLLIERLNWSKHRTEKALNDLLRDGIVWLDEPSSDQEKNYWFPGLCRI
ncbi:putative oxidoreductase [Sarcoptes scabiei]|nr:putative oxidoreductase [Sarcoptes scabiei]